MDLEVEFTYQIFLDTALFVGTGPFGTRMVASLDGGWVKGERISGSFVGAGADWALLGSDGFARVDVRAQIVTDDQAMIYIAYTGLMELNEAVRKAMAAGGETDWDDQYFCVAPRFETGDERYDWLNTSMFLARGRVVPGGVEYEVYRVAAG